MLCRVALGTQISSVGNWINNSVNFDKELLQADQHLFNRFKKIPVEKSIKTAAEVIDALHENTLYEIAPEFSKVGVRFGRHSYIHHARRKVCSADSGG